MADDGTRHETIEVLVTVSTPGDGALDLRVSPRYHEELRGLLDEHGIAHSTALEFSAGTGLAIEVVQVLQAGGLAGLTTVLVTFIRRHKGKRFIMDPDGRIEAGGYPEREVRDLIDHVAAKQRERDAEWDRIKGGSGQQPLPSVEGSVDENQTRRPEAR